MACDPNTLLSQAACLLCNFPASDSALMDAVEIAMLCAIRDGDPMACDANTLLEDAKCLICTIPPGAMQAVKLSILCGLAVSGVGGAQQVYTGAAPPAAPDNPALPAVFYPTGGGALLQWDGAAWV